MDSLLIAARAVHCASTILLCGLFAFFCLVAGPAMRRTVADRAPSLRREFAWLGWASLGVALVSGAAWLVATASTMSGEAFAAVLTKGVLATVLTQTRFGQVWLVRLALALLLGCCLAAQSRRSGPVGGVAAWIGLAFAAPLLASLAWSGHGAATPGSAGDLHLAADLLHLLAAGLWLGTLLPLGLLLARARRGGGTGWTAVAGTASRRYSALAGASVAVLLGSGLVNTWFLAGTVPALIGTGYGHLLLAKIAIFATMLVIAAVNLFRLTPRLAAPARVCVGATLGQLRRNAYIEAGCGLAVLAIVGVLGTLPPGLHTEPGWPLPFRIDPAELGKWAGLVLSVSALLSGIAVVAGVALAAAGRYRRAASALVVLVPCLAAAWLTLRRAIEPAYPTSFYASTEPYAAPSVAHGQALYAENCALCHGAGGKGDGPAAAGLSIRPADLTAPHLLAHSPGDLFWWVSRGRADGAMPGFAGVIGAPQRWDVINFVRARAAAVLSRRLGPAVGAGAAFPVPDFAFEQNGRQHSLAVLLQRGPVLLILFSPPPPAAYLGRLAAARQQLAAAGLATLAIGLGPAPPRPAPDETAPTFVVGVSREVTSTLRLFAPDGDRGPSALLLDRAGNIRARWTEDISGGLADPAIVAAAAVRVARFPAAAPSHAGHAH